MNHRHILIKIGGVVTLADRIQVQTLVQAQTRTLVSTVVPTSLVNPILVATSDVY